MIRGDPMRRDRAGGQPSNEGKGRKKPRPVSALTDTSQLLSPPLTCYYGEKVVHFLVSEVMVISQLFSSAS